MPVTDLRLSVYHAFSQLRNNYREITRPQQPYAALHVMLNLMCSRASGQPSQEPHINKLWEWLGEIPISYAISYAMRQTCDKPV